MFLLDLSSLKMLHVVHILISLVCESQATSSFGILVKDRSLNPEPTEAPSVNDTIEEFQNGFTNIYRSILLYI